MMAPQTLLLLALLGAQAAASAPTTTPPAVTAPPPVTAPPALVEPQAPLPLLRAQYEWGYAGADGQGKGTLSVLIEPGPGRLILELQGLGERLMLLEGNAASGFHIQIPRQKLDQQAPTLAAVPLPFLPQVGSPSALYRLLTEGSGPGVKVSKRDKLGPVKMRYEGVDEKNREVLVWLQRTRWEPQGAATAKVPAH